jgi:hypothetical protein
MTKLLEGNIPERLQFDRQTGTSRLYEKNTFPSGKRTIPGQEDLGESHFYHAGPGDQTDYLANKLSQHVEVYHIPSKESVFFKAAITSFTDTLNQSWNSTPVFGRMDNIATYQRTSRQVQVGIDIMAASFAEAKVNFERLSLLQQMQYPVMDGNFEDGSAHIKGGPLVKIKFLNWISRGSAEGNASSRGLMGWIEGIQFSPKLDLGTFQDGLILYPKGYMINLNLNVIHEENLGWKVNKRGKATPVNSKFPYGADSKPSQENTRGVLEELKAEAEFSRIDELGKERLKDERRKEAEAKKILEPVGGSNITGEVGTIIPPINNP